MTDTSPAIDLASAEEEVDLPPIGDRARYDALMEVVRNRVTVRKFDPQHVVPDEHYDLILEAARHAPSGANAQPWQFIVVRDAATKQQIADYFVAEQRFRAKAKMKFPFELLSDAEEAVCTRFGVMKLKNMYGKKVRGIERSTFVIDAKGVLAREWRGVRVPGHAEEVLHFVQAL